MCTSNCQWILIVSGSFPTSNQLQNIYESYLRIKKIYIILICTHPLKTHVGFCTGLHATAVPSCWFWVDITFFLNVTFEPIQWWTVVVPLSAHLTISERHLNAASAGPAERVEEERKPAELGPIGSTQTPRLSSLGRKRLCGSSSGLQKKSHCFYSVTKFQRWRGKIVMQS